MQQGRLNASECQCSKFPFCIITCGWLDWFQIVIHLLVDSEIGHVMYYESRKINIISRKNFCALEFLTSATPSKTSADLNNIYSEQ